MINKVPQLKLKRVLFFFQLRVAKSYNCGILDWDRMNIHTEQATLTN